MKTLDFNLTVDEANVIMQALGNLPYAQVSALIEKMREQAKPQLETQTHSGI